VAVPVVFGARWIPAIPILQVFLVMGASQSVAALAGPVWIAKGQARLLLRWSVFGNFAMVAAFALGAWLGSPVWVAAASCGVSACLLTPLSVWISRRYVGLTLEGLERRVFRALFDATLMGLVVTIFDRLLRGVASETFRLLVEIPLGVAVYVGLFRVRDPAEFSYLASLLRNRA
jgi:O-antigen/teichoic acid export membrane protein